MWVDALCINQTDNVERAEQVAKMGSIYSRTSHLIVWLGEVGEGSDLAMDLILKHGQIFKDGPIEPCYLADTLLIKTLDVREGATFDPTPWVVVNRLFRRLWFERLWVLCFLINVPHSLTLLLLGCARDMPS